MFDKFRTEHTPQTLLEAAAKFNSSIIPWVGRDLTKKSYNTGQWRLQESPLFFLIKNRCLLDPAGNPFILGQAYDGFGDSPKFYERAPEKIFPNGMNCQRLTRMLKRRNWNSNNRNWFRTSIPST